MCRQVLTLFLAVLLFAFTATGVALGVQTGMAAAQPSANVFASFTKGGVQTAGVSNTVHDVYFDGYTLMLTITQSSNETGYSVYNDMLGDYDIADITRKTQNAGDTPLGSYCEIELADHDGKVIESPMAGEETRQGASSIRTYCYRFLPGEVRESLRIHIFYGIMETPGELAGEMDSIEFTVPLQERAQTKSIQIVHIAGELPYIDEVFIAHTARLTGIFDFYRCNAAGACTCPVDFINTAQEELSATPYGDKSGDPLRRRGYIYHAIRSTEPLDTLRLLDLHSNQQYLIDLDSGDVRKAE